MSTPDEVGEGTVSGNQVSIPAHIRDRFDIEDGDVLRWKIVDDELRVEVFSQESDVFDDFKPGKSADVVEVVRNTTNPDRSNDWKPIDTNYTHHPFVRTISTSSSS